MKHVLFACQILLIPLWLNVAIISFVYCTRKKENIKNASPLTFNEREAVRKNDEAMEIIKRSAFKRGNDNRDSFLNILKILDEARTLDPNNEVVVANKFNALCALKNYIDAIKLTDTMYKKNTNKVFNLNYQGLLYLKMKKNKEADSVFQLALSRYNELLAKKTDNSKLLIDYIQLLFVKDGKPKALQVLDVFINKYPKDKRLQDLKNFLETTDLKQVIEEL